MRSSYSEEDVILLLKDITGLVEPQPAKVQGETDSVRKTLQRDVAC